MKRLPHYMTACCRGGEMRKSEKRYVSMFSGIEAATVAWHELGWKPVAFSDFDKFPKAVLAHHYPDVPDLGDVTKVNWNEYGGKADVVVGGSPCQSFSVAGKRLGMDDPRGNLALHFLGAVKAIKPTWFIFENVPGLLSSDGGRDFAAFLGEVAKCGYGFAYRVLDSQYFGVPQRRRRLFVVGHSDGDWRSAFSVLFERESLFGNPPPSIEQGQGLAAFTKESVEREDSEGSARRGIDSVERQIIGEFWDGTDKTATLTTRSIDQSMPDKGNFMGITQELYENHGQASRITKVDTAPTLAKKMGTGGNNIPLVGEKSTVFNNHFMTSRHEELDGIAPTLAANAEKGSVPLVTETNTFSRGGHGTYSENEDEKAGVLTAHASKDVETIIQSVFNIDSEGGNSMKSKNPLSGSQQIDKASTLTTFPPSPEGYRGGNAVVSRHVVRRLTPIECERLQGFPDNYTQIPWRGKDSESCPDGVRYKALGNSMAVPVMKWIAMGIDAVDGVLAEVGKRPDPVRVEQKSIFDF
jgi:DNA (cytosine-5)-methyltransferase 1